MHGTRRLFLLFLGCVYMGATSVHAAMASDRVTDPLDRPAQISVRAQDAMVTAVARAGERLVAVGERGTILLSDNNGQTWRQAKRVPVSLLLTGVRFGSARKGWAVGHSGVVLHSEDGGDTWVKQLDGNAVAKIALMSAQAAVKAGGDDAEAKKDLVDAQRLVQDGADKPFLDLLVENDSTVIVVGAFGLALRTEDGGKTWRPWQSRILGDKGSHLYGIQQSGNTIYIVGEQGSVFRSTDNGVTLSELTTPYKGSFFGLSVLSDSQVLVYGLRGNAFASNDAGANWQPAKVGTPASLTASLVLADGAILMANQAGGLLKSADHGLTFSIVPVPNPVPIVGMAQAPDGSIVLAGLRGTSHLPANSSTLPIGAK
ncbi:Uncharacterized protein SAMN04515620_14718 [Collimonas sp. OK607]|uniref:WD40/YVTN/BNR-like repeat-containing protein n=1 Tax=Collimonas sp. OK607 TaxID=1798194 RepID=UPI0008F245C5|nr:YCF48-related protein [Collimonas sp. OK607]SFB34635.1 Uncharacterized protein SAMN04515620_14718 [Collimonas sp. OK607]